MTVLKFVLPETSERRSAGLADSISSSGDLSNVSFLGDRRELVESRDSINLAEHSLGVCPSPDGTPEADLMDKALIQKKVTDALGSIAEHKAAQVARYFGIDGEPAEQSIDEAAASRAVLDAFQEAAPGHPKNIDLLLKLHDIAGKIADASDANPDILRALRKPPVKKPPVSVATPKAEKA
jgi:hypothetical protein